jgi:ribosomal protein L16/L10AE
VAIEKRRQKQYELEQARLEQMRHLKRASRRWFRV